MRSGLEPALKRLRRLLAERERHAQLPRRPVMNARQEPRNPRRELPILPLAGLQDNRAVTLLMRPRRALDDLVIAHHKARHAAVALANAAVIAIFVADVAELDNPAKIRLCPDVRQFHLIGAAIQPVKLLLSR